MNEKNQKEYYQTPSKEVFEEVKQACKEIWATYDDEYGYATEKIKRVDLIGNVSDNIMFMIGMFDTDNMAKLALKLSPETNQIIINKLLSVGNHGTALIFKI